MLGGETMVRIPESEWVQAAQLLQAVRDYRREYENPVPDYLHRATLRKRLFELAGEEGSDG